MTEIKPSIGPYQIEGVIAAQMVARDPGETRSLVQIMRDSGWLIQSCDNVMTRRALQAVLDVLGVFATPPVDLDLNLENAEKLLANDGWTVTP